MPCQAVVDAPQFAATQQQIANRHARPQNCPGLSEMRVRDLPKPADHSFDPLALRSGEGHMGQISLEIMRLPPPGHFSVEINRRPRYRSRSL